MMMAVTAFSNDTNIPPWLQEHCIRLKAIDSDITNLNLNIRRLNRPMMEALSKAICANPRIEMINFTSSLMNNVPPTRPAALLPPQQQPLQQVGQQQQPNLNPAQPHDQQQQQVSSTPPVGSPYDAALPLAELVLPNHPSLQKIHLSYNRLSCCISIGTALLTNTVLKELYLDYNLLDASSGIALANGLRYNKSLKVLQLKSNKIGDVGGVALAKSLQTNTTLIQLGLSNNMLGVESGNAFLNLLRSNQNITVTTLSLDENPCMPVEIRNQIQFYIRANQVGIQQILRRQYYYYHQQHQTTNTTNNNTNINENSTNCFSNSIWPFILEELEPDMVYYFLQQKPDVL